MAEGFARAAFEPGDDICPPWPWWWRRPGPPPPWWDDSLVELGRDVFAGLTLVNLAAHVADVEVSRVLARTGAELVGKSAQAFTETLSQ